MHQPLWCWMRRAYQHTQSQAVATDLVRTAHPTYLCQQTWYAQRTLRICASFFGPKANTMQTMHPAKLAAPAVGAFPCHTGRG